MFKLRIMLCLALASCSALPLLGLADDPSLGLEAVIGDKEESVVGRVGSTTETETESLFEGARHE